MQGTLPQNALSPIKRRYFRWIDRRAPVAKKVRLTRKNLYILPTVTGFLFLALCLVLWLLGTSYQNNLILALCYFLSSLMVVAILHTYANLAGLKIQAQGAKAAFVGDSVAFSLQVIGAQRDGCNNIDLRWWSGQSKRIDIKGNDAQSIIVENVAMQRGYFNPGKLLIQSTFPLGLFRCWSWANLDTRALIYPKPVHCEPLANADWDSDAEQGESVKGGDDFSGLKAYQAGDPIKHIAWKQYAREQGLYTKEYTRVRLQDVWLTWENFAHLSVEARLSALCYWALEYHRLEIPYGLNIPSKTVPPGLGESHLIQLLTALATYDIAQERR